MVLGESACWMSKFQRIEYGLCMSGLRNETACPAKVARPAEEPAGREKPFGKGLLSVVCAAAGFTRPLLGHGDGGGLAEALLVDFRVGGVVAGDGQVRDGHGRDEHAECSAE